MSQLAIHTVKTVTKSVNALVSILEKIPAFLEEKQISEFDLLNAKLADDMMPLLKQIQLVSDNGKGIVSRLSQTENPNMPDTEQTFAELATRLKKTLEYMNSISDEQYANFENATATFPWLPGKFMTAIDYMVEFAIPNFYFHYATTYAILRKEGMNIGKYDYIGGLTLNDL